MNGSLIQSGYEKHELFGLEYPTSCEGVPSDILNPKNTWADKNAYDQKANQLAELFINNFEKYKAKASAEMLAAAPRLLSDLKQ